MVGVGGALDLQLAVDLAHRRVDLDRDLPAGGVQLPPQVERVAIEPGAVGDEPHLRVTRDVEEVLGAQMLVALLLFRIQAARFDRQLHRGCGAEVERALIVGELSLDGHQTVEVAHMERDARTRRIKPPSSIGNQGGGSGFRGGLFGDAHVDAGLLDLGFGRS